MADYVNSTYSTVDIGQYEYWAPLSDDSDIYHDLDKTIAKYSLNDIIERIGIDKVESYLRAKKLDKLRKK